jgi:hypothetical protein
VGEALAEVLRDGTVRRQGGWVPRRCRSAAPDLPACSGIAFHRTALGFAARQCIQAMAVPAPLLLLCTAELFVTSKLDNPDHALTGWRPPAGAVF